jgi:hypothetical protein
LAVSETFAPAAECLLFYAAYIRGQAEARPLSIGRDMGTIILANVGSFLVGGPLLAWAAEANWLGL